MTASANPFASLGLADPRRTAQQGNALRQGAEQSSQRLGQKDFLKLMITQFKNQDPTHPMQDGQFLGQLAQFGTVSGIQQLQGSFSTLADSLHSEQAMRAATLVGHRVMAASDSANLSTGGSLNGAVDVPDGGGHVKLTISDSTGHKVKQIDLGTQPGGLADFAWDGRAGRHGGGARHLQDQRGTG
jgi:flagellar basal-body rod modification protein FlgD